MSNRLLTSQRLKIPRGGSQRVKGQSRVLLLQPASPGWVGGWQRGRGTRLTVKSSPKAGGPESESAAPVQDSLEALGGILPTPYARGGGGTQSRPLWSPVGFGIRSLTPSSVPPIWRTQGSVPAGGGDTAAAFLGMAPSLPGLGRLLGRAPGPLQQAPAPTHCGALPPGSGLGRAGVAGDAPPGPQPPRLPCAANPGWPSPGPEGVGARGAGSWGPGARLGGGGRAPIRSALRKSFLRPPPVSGIGERGAEGRDPSPFDPPTPLRGREDPRLQSRQREAAGPGCGAPLAREPCQAQPRGSLLCTPRAGGGAVSLSPFPRTPGPGRAPGQVGGCPGPPPTEAEWGAGRPAWDGGWGPQISRGHSAPLRTRRVLLGSPHPVLHPGGAC